MRSAWDLVKHIAGVLPPFPCHTPTFRVLLVRLWPRDTTCPSRTITHLHDIGQADNTLLLLALLQHADLNQRWSTPYPSCCASTRTAHPTGTSLMLRAFSACREVHKRLKHDAGNMDTQGKGMSSWLAFHSCKTRVLQACMPVSACSLSPPQSVLAA
jgi:hypothetical protein